MKEIIEEHKEKIYEYKGDKITKTIKYQANDGTIWGNAESAKNHEEIQNRINRVKKLTLDSLFGPEGGVFYYFLNFDEMNFIIKHEFDDIINFKGNEVEWSDIHPEMFTFPEWYYLLHQDGGDSYSVTEIKNYKEIKENIQETLNAFTYISVIANEN